MKKKSKKTKRRIPIEKLKPNDRVYIRNNISDQDIINHTFKETEFLLRQEDVKLFRALPLTYMCGAADAKFCYVEFAIFDGRLPRKWLTLNPSRISSEQTMPDTREYLELVHLQLT